MADFRKRLRECVTNAGSISALERAAGLPRGNISHYLDRGSEPSISAIIAIARGAGVSVQWLATGENDPQKQGPPFVNGDVLQQILSGIDEGERRRGTRINSEGKARLAALFYDMWVRGELPRHDRIIQMVSKAA